MTNFFVRHNWIFLLAVFVLFWFFTEHTSINFWTWLLYASAVAISLFIFYVLEKIKIVRKIRTMFKDGRIRN